jgi:hypothetical protein
LRNNQTPPPSKQPQKTAYEFLNNRDEPATKAILEKNGIDIRVSVYHYANRQLERLCNATSNPTGILQAHPLPAFASAQP